MPDGLFGGLCCVSVVSPGRGCRRRQADVLLVEAVPVCVNRYF
jgi:hypothetical protein